MSFWSQLLVETPIALAGFFAIGALLWRLRSWGYWTVGIGFALFILSCVAQNFITHGKGSHAVAQGLFLGTMMPTLYAFLYQLS